MNPEKTTPSRTMIFAPAPARKRLQLRLSERRLLLMAGDALSIVIAVFIALRVWAEVGRIPFTLEFILPQTVWFFMLTGLWLLLASASDFYELAVAASRTESMYRLVAITLQMLVVYLIIFFLSERDALPRLFIVYYGLASFVLIVLWRLLNPALLGWASTPRRALIIGADAAAASLIEVLRREAPSAYTIVGLIGDEARVGDTVQGVPVVGSGLDILSRIVRDSVTEIILPPTQELSGDLFQGVMDAYERGVMMTPMPLVYERVSGRVPVEHVGNHWTVVLPLGGASSLNPYPILKRLLDMLLAAAGLLPVALLLPLLALLIYLDSPGSIFYSQERTGLNGRSFRILKLRTMIPDAEKQTGAVFAQQNDARVTRVGRFLRRTRLDELPQLWNVLKGDMSLVGPRPERPQHVARLQAKIPFYRTRHIIRPGLTGWAQVRYHYGANDDDARIKLQYDLYYIRHRSLLLDFKILLKTVWKVAGMQGQ
jgi:exopolysaccharide biosynthesis polyprenyl glycosylphosphotransferase